MSWLFLAGRVLAKNLHPSTCVFCLVIRGKDKCAEDLQGEDLRYLIWIKEDTKIPFKEKVLTKDKRNRLGILIEYWNARVWSNGFLFLNRTSIL